jgi:hypothetical protein
MKADIAPSIYAGPQREITSVVESTCTVAGTTTDALMDVGLRTVAFKQAGQGKAALTLTQGSCTIFLAIHVTSLAPQMCKVRVTIMKEQQGIFEPRG